MLESSGKTYADWWLATQQFLAGFSESERGAMLGGNAARIYRLVAPL